jgi:hypothetical protein
LTEKGQKAARQTKSTMDKKGKNCFLSLWVTLQMGHKDDDNDDE